MKIFNDIKKEKLTLAEKEVGLNKLRMFMNKENFPTTSPWYSFHSVYIFSQKKYITGMAFVLLVFVLTGGTSTLAEFSLPGDLLYPVKINFNEKVESLTAKTAEEKALIEVDHINTRLLEVEKLETIVDISDVNKKAIEEQFKTNLSQAVIYIGTLDNSGKGDDAEKLEVSIENSLQRHKETVGRILEKKTEKVVKSFSATDKTIATTTEVKTITAQSAPEVKELKNEDFSKTSTTEEKATSTRSENLERREKNAPLLKETLERAFPRDKSRKEKKD